MAAKLHISLSLFLPLEGFLMKSLVVQMPCVSQECHQVMFNHEMTTCAYRCDYSFSKHKIKSKLQCWYNCGKIVLFKQPFQNSLALSFHHNLCS